MFEYWTTNFIALRTCGDEMNLKKYARVTIKNGMKAQ